MINQNLSVVFGKCLSAVYDSSMAVTAVIPNYNGLKLLKKHLNDVVACLDDGDELVIVDDASSDGSVAELEMGFSLQKVITTPRVENLPKDYFPRVNQTEFQIYFGKIDRARKKVRLVVVVNPENYRFGQAVNVGVALATHQRVFVVNNDVSPAPDAIKVLNKHFDDERVFAVGCLELLPLDSNQKSGKNKLWFNKGLFHHSKAEDLEYGHTAWVSGGSGLFDRDKWLELGGFDKLFYPAYWEDIDLSFRAKKRGWQVLFDPNAIVYHVHETTNSDIFGQQKIKEMSWQNSDRFTWKNGSILQKLEFLIFKPYWWLKRNGEAQEKSPPSK